MAAEIKNNRRTTTMKKNYVAIELKIQLLSCDIVTASISDGVGLEWNTEKWGSSQWQGQ